MFSSTVWNQDYKRNKNVYLSEAECCYKRRAYKNGQVRQKKEFLFLGKKKKKKMSIKEE